jgi:hypothetical protein
MDNHHGQCGKIWCQLQTYKCQVCTCISVHKRHCLICTSSGIPNSCFLLFNIFYIFILLAHSHVPSSFLNFSDFKLYIYSLWTFTKQGCINTFDRNGGVNFIEEPMSNLPPWKSHRYFRCKHLTDVMLLDCCLLDLFINSEDEASLFHQNISKILLTQHHIKKDSTLHQR